MAVNNVIGDAWIEIHGKTDKLKKDIEDAFKLSPASQKKMQDNLQKSMDTAFRKLDIQKYLDMEFDVKAKLDSDQLIEELLALETLLSELSTVHIKVKIDDSALDELQSLMNIVNETKTIKIVADSAKAAAEIKKTAQKTTAEIEPEVASGPKKLTQLELAILTRDRIVNIRTMIDKNVPAQFVKAFTGYRLTQEALEIGFNVMMNLDRMVPKIATITGGVSLVSGAVLNLISDFSLLVKDIARIVPILLPIPGIIVGLGLGIGGLIAAFKDFNEVLPGVGDEFGKLQDIISGAFWKEAKAPIREFIDVLMPQLKTSYKDTGTELGLLFANLSTSFQNTLLKVPEGGQSPLQFIFEKLNESISISSQYTEVFADMITRLGVIGAKYLPDLSRWIGDLITKFDVWLATADIDGFIQTAIANIGYLWDSLSSLVGIFSAFGQAAETAGSGGLKSFAEALENIEEVVNGPAFQTGLSNIFRSANGMMEQISERSGPALSRFFEVFGQQITNVFDTMGPVLGNFIREFAEAFSSPEFIEGFESFISGVAKGIQGFSGSLGGIADGVGEFLSLMGAAVESLLPLIGEILVVINEWTEPFAGALEAIVRWLGSLSPELVVITVLIGKLMTTGVSAAIGIMKLATAFSSFGASSPVLAGALARIVPGIAALTGVAAPATAATATMSSAMGVAGAAIGGTTLAAAGIAAGVGVGIAALGKLFTSTSIIIPETKDLSAGLLNIGDSSSDAGDALRGLLEQNNTLLGYNIGGKVDTWSDAIDAYGESAKQAAYASESWFHQMSDWLFSGDSDKKFQEQTKAIDTSLTDLVDSGNWQAASQRFADLSQSLLDQGYSVEEITELYPEYTAVVEENTDALGRWAPAITAARDAARAADDAFMSSTDTLFDYEATTSSFTDTLAEINKEFADSTGTQHEWTTAITEGTDAEKEAFEATQKKWEALKQVGTATSEYVNSQIELNGLNEDTIAKYKEQQDQLYNNAIAAGMAEEEARKYANAAMDIPSEVITEFMAQDGITDVTTKIGEDLYEIDGRTGTVFMNGDVTDFNAARDLLLAKMNEKLVFDIPVNLGEMDVAEQERILREKLVSMNIEIPAGIDDMEANAQILALMTLITDSNPALSVGAETSAAAVKVGDVIQTATGEVTIPVGAEISTAENGITTVRGMGEAPIEIVVDADTGLATEKGAFTRGELTAPAAIELGLNTDQAYLKYAAMKADIRGDVATLDINADTGNAASVFNTLKDTIRGTVATFKIHADTSVAYSKFTAMKTDIRGDVATFKIDTNTDPGYLKYAAFKRDVRGDTATFKIDANTGPAASKLASLYSSIVNKTITVYVRRVETSANGNLYSSVKSFASGGVERHIAQIANASSLGRFWAEPETGGEAYIPLALSKRNRSLEILDEVAKIFGYMLIPNMKKFADGGLLDGLYSSSSNATPLSTISRESSTRRGVNNTVVYNISMEINASDLEGIRSIEQFVQTVRRKTRQGAG